MISIYVSPAGDDTNPGSLSAPVKTLTKAQQLVREIVSRVPQDVTVYLRSGVYRLDSPLEFDQRDSGKDRCVVLWRNYQAEVVQISGGVPVTGWQPLAANPEIYVAANTNRSRQLYVNGAPATRARKPNVGSYYRLVRWYGIPKPIDSVDQDNRTIAVRWEDISPGFALDGSVEMVIQKDWAQHRLKITGVSGYPVESGVQLALIEFDPLMRDASFNARTPNKYPLQAYHLEGSLAFLTEVGEFFDSAAENQLYYKPAAGGFSATVPKLDSLIKVDQGLNLWFQGIEFAETGWNQPTVWGHADWWGNQKLLPDIPGIDTESVKTPAAIDIRYSKNIRLINCQFRNCGAIGVLIGEGGQQCVVQNCEFINIASVPLVLAGKKNIVSAIYYYDQQNPVEYAVSWHENEQSDIPAEDQNLNNRVLNNLFEGIGFDYGANGAIYCGYTIGTVIEHNTIRNAPHNGIALGWGFTAEPTIQRNNLVRANLIDGCMQLYTDGGAIYQMSNSQGTRIEENLIKNIAPSPWAARQFVCGIYLEYGCTGVTFQRNVFQNVLIQPTESQLFWYNWPANQNTLIDNESQHPDVIANAGRR